MVLLGGASEVTSRSSRPYSAGCHRRPSEPVLPRPRADPERREGRDGRIIEYRAAMPGCGGPTVGGHGVSVPFFHNREEEYRSVLLPLAKEGSEQGEKVFHIVDREHRPERMRYRLEEVGISPAAARRAPVRSRSSPGRTVYLRGGCFDVVARMTLLEETLRGAKADGFGQTRVWANMDWALGDFPGVEDLVEYETRVHHLVPRYHDLVVCASTTLTRLKFDGRHHDGCPPHPSAGHHRRVSP